VEELTARRARTYKLDQGKGVVISEISPNGVAADVGLKPGDVITKIDRTEVTSAKVFSDAIGKAKIEDGIKLNVRTEDGMDRLVYIEKK
jgi:serine protease Do